MFHLSDLKSYQSCPRLFMHQKEDKPPFIAYTQMSMSMDDVLIQKLGAENYFKGMRGMDSAISLVALSNYPWLFGARFEYADLRVKIPGIKVEEDGLRIYFTVYSMHPRIEDSCKFANHLWVLEQLGLKINAIEVLYFNPQYVRGKILDIDACFLLSEDFIKNNGFVQSNILEHVRKYQSDLSEELEAMRHCEWSQADLKTCPLLTRCEYFGKCFDQKKFSDFHPLYFSASHKRQYIRMGYQDIRAIPLDQEGLSRLQKAQFKAAINEDLYYDKETVFSWLASVEHPSLSFIDFEWDTYGIPPYEGMQAYDVLVFQYSLHFYRDGMIDHREFLGQEDCREAFIQSLIKHIPAEGPILAYNAYGAEKIRILELAHWFPHYEEALMKIASRFVDFAYLFGEGYLYHPKMHGNYSLKKIIEAILPEFSYDQLSISHGLEAVSHHRSLINEDDEAVKEALLSYCRMDTLAMVKLYQWLLTLRKGEYHA